MNSILSYGAIVLIAATCIATIAMSAHRAMSRQPEVQQQAFITFVLGAAFCESLGLLGFLLALLSNN